MRPTDFFSPDYATARKRFLAAAQRAGARWSAHPLSAQGPDGETLAIDVATLGPAAPERLVLVSSGLHGIEGFFGSAVQLAWLLERGSHGRLPPRTTVVLVHALNPFGFAWRRRWNENNVDLNRNFLDDRGFLADDATYRESRQAYERLSRFLNPPSPPSRREAYRLKAVLRLLAEGYEARTRRLREGRQAPSRFSLSEIRELGLRELQKTLPVGQYEYPQGLFYGGQHPEETVRIVRQQLPRWTAGAGDVVHLDLHSGLGDYADYRLLLVDEKGSRRERWAAEHFGEERVEAQGGKTAYAARGLMAKDLQDRMPETWYRCFTAEFGTYSGAQVLGALRAENRAHFYDSPGTRSYAWAKQTILEAFCPSAPPWREAVIEKGLKVFEQALAACGDAPRQEQG